MVGCDADRRTYDSHLWVSPEGRHSILTTTPIFFPFFFFLSLTR